MPTISRHRAAIFLSKQANRMSDALDQLAASSEAAAVAKFGVAAGSATSVIFGISAEVVGIVFGIGIALTSLVYQIWATERRIKILRQIKNADNE